MMNAAKKIKEIQETETTDLFKFWLCVCVCVFT